MHNIAKLLLAVCLAAITMPAFAQQRIQFSEPDSTRQAALSRIVSIDAVQGSLYTAYASEAELQALTELGYSYTVVEEPQPKVINMATTIAQLKGWDRYPTYSTYVDFMQMCVDSFPTICRLDTIGYSIQGRLLLSLKISDNVALDEAEPEFFYSSTMHGDEVTGFYFMLHLIDTLLASYGVDSNLTWLVNNTQIYINPDANPDGTYYSSNNSVQGSRRYNANSIDLNRNYPDPFGSAPLSTVQQENVAMMQYISDHRFVLSANLHGGSEVMNYPWDSYTSSQRKHADYYWWQAVSKRYVDTCRYYGNNNWYNDVNNSGYICGGNWYVISNGRQDYVNYYAHCREMTMEVSSTKTLSTSSLRNYWNKQSHSLINYIFEIHKGFHGTVTDTITGQPLHAFVEVLDYDRDSSQIYSSALHGDYYRLLLPGTYQLRFSAPGYAEKELTATIGNDGATLLNVQLMPDSLPCAAPESLQVTETANTSATIDWTVSATQNAWTIHVFNDAFDSLYTVTSHPATVGGLIADNTYNVIVSGMCFGFLQSDWSDTIQFTLSVCDSVSNVIATVNGTSVSIAWTIGESGSGVWQLLYGKVGEETTNGPIIITANPYTLENLSSGNYEAYVRTVCDTDQFSSWSEPVTFTITTQGQSIADLNSNLHIDIYPNPTNNITTIALGGVNGNVSIAIVDMNGRVIRTDYMVCSGDCTKTLAVRNLAKGAYFLHVYGDSVNAVKKLIVK